MTVMHVFDLHTQSQITLQLSSIFSMSSLQLVCLHSTTSSLCAVEAHAQAAPPKYLSSSLTLTYRIAGKFGGEFNLADWRICERTAKLNSANIP